MAKKTFVLCDVEEDVYVEGISVGPAQVGGAARG